MNGIGEEDILRRNNSKNKFREIKINFYSKKMKYFFLTFSKILKGFYQKKIKLKKINNFFINIKRHSLKKFF